MRVRTFRVCADLAPKQGHKGLNRVRSAPHDPEVDAFTYGQWDGMNYRLATPKGNRPANRPLVVWLHGNGEGGVSADEYNNESQLRANRGAIVSSLGEELEPSIEKARAYLMEAIRNAPGFGQGHQPLGHNWPCKLA